MKELNFRVAGVTFEGRQEVISKLDGGEACLLKPEPQNPFDPNAIAVYVARTPDVEHVGYVPREVAAEIAPHLEGESLLGRVSQVTGGFVKFDGSQASFGLRVLVEIPTDEIER